MFPSSGAGPPEADSMSARPRNRRPNAAAAAAAQSTTSSASGSPTRGTFRVSAQSSFTADTSPLGERSGRLGNHTGGSVGRNNGSRLQGGGSSSVSSWVPTWSSIQDFASTLLLTGGSGEAASGSGGVRSKSPTVWGPAPPGDHSASAAGASAGTRAGAGAGKLSHRPRIQDVAAGSTAAREAELRARKTASVLESHPGVNGGLDVRGNYKRRTSDDITRDAGTPFGTLLDGDVSSQAQQQQQQEERLVYIHHVQPTDTYFGIILKYKCQEDAFRRANGLWSRDNIQARKWVALPVDACEVKGRPCDDPSLFSPGTATGGSVDLLSSTPAAVASSSTADGGNDYFGSPRRGRRSSSSATRTSLRGGSSNNWSSDRSRPVGAATAALSDDMPGEVPWTHVRWVRLDACEKPVEMARISRTALGFFPPRRKKSLHGGTVSTVSTPRQSLDLLGSSLPSERSMAGTESPGGGGNNNSSTRFAQSQQRRPSVLGSRSSLLGSSPVSSLSPSRYAGSTAGAVDSTDDPRPAWMRRPGGVGTMGKSVRAPGPSRDPLNKWATKHLPGLNDMETLPSMSVMGSETAHFGFGDTAAHQVGGDALTEGTTATGVGLVESPFADGRDLALSSRQDSGLDKAAATIENWLRGAFAKPSGGGAMGGGGATGGGGSGYSYGNANGGAGVGTPSTSFATRLGQQLEETLGDLIEMEVGSHEDGGLLGGKPSGSGRGEDTGLLAVPLTKTTPSSSWQSTDAMGPPRSRSTKNKGKGKKAD